MSASDRIDERLRRILACPYDGAALAQAQAGHLACPLGHEFPVVEGVPMLLRDDVPMTLDAARASLERAKHAPGPGSKSGELYLDTLGISQAERADITRLAEDGSSAIDPVVQYLIGATCGRAYVGAMGSLSDYPIPDIPLPASSGARLLDVGCNWGRWSIAAARKGYAVVGVDPQLGAVLAGQRVAAQVGLAISFVCADARHLPFVAGSIDTVFSYSVLQHFHVGDLLAALGELRRVLSEGGVSVVQMANAWGLHNVWVRARRGSRRPRDFEVRYYAPRRLKTLFSGAIGPTALFADGYLGLGLQPSDRLRVSRLARAAIAVSKTLKYAAGRVPALACLADSVFLRSMRGAGP